MLSVARRRHRLPVVQADLRQLPLADTSVALVVAYYVVHHLPRRRLPAALDEIARVLRPDGVLALAVHLGDGEVVTEEFLGHRIEPMAVRSTRPTGWPTA